MLGSSPADPAVRLDDYLGEAPRESTPEPSAQADVFLTTIDDLFTDLDAARETGAMAAVIGEPVEDILSRNKALHERAMTALGERFRARHQILSSDLDASRAHESALVAALPALQNRKDELRAEMASSNVAERESAEQARADLRLARARRAEFIRAERQAEDRSEYERKLEAAAQQAKLAELQAQASGLSDDDPIAAERRRVALAKEFDSVAALYEDVRLMNHELQKKGFTRNIARFLNWSSMLSFVGIGLVLAHLFAGSFPGLGSDPRAALQLRQLLNPTGEASLLSMFGYYALVVGAFWLFALAIAWLTIRLLGALDEKNRRQRTRSERSPQDLGGLMSLFGLPGGNFGDQLPVADRKLLVQVVSALPVAVLAALVGFYWIVSADPNSGPAVDPASFQLVYLGSLYAVMTCTAGTLFWLYVVRPRVVRERVEAASATLYTVSFIAPVVGLFVLANATEATTRLAIAFVGAALLLTAGAAGHGIYLKGLFAREAYLEREHHRLFADLHGRPSLPFAAIRQAESAVMRRIRAAGWSLSQFLSRSKKERQPRQGDLADALVRSALNQAHAPASVVEAVNRSQAEYVSKAAVRDSVVAALAHVESDIQSATSQLSALRASIHSTLIEIAEVVERHEASLLSLHGRFDDFQTAVSHAFGLAKVFRTVRV